MPAELFAYLKANRKTLIIGAILAFVGLYYFWFFLLSGDFFSTHSRNESDRQILLKVRNDIQLGDSYEKVLQNFWSKKHKDSQLGINVYSPKEWSIVMQSELFATDWRMYIKFQEGKVVAYKIRTSDGPKPVDAPEDIGQIDE